MHNTNETRVEKLLNLTALIPEGDWLLPLIPEDDLYTALPFDVE